MKKIFLTFAVIFLLSVNSFAGWIHSSGVACDPATSPPKTCFYVEDFENPNRSANPDEDSDSIIRTIKTFVFDYTPLGFLL